MALNSKFEVAQAAMNLPRLENLTGPADARGVGWKAGFAIVSYGRRVGVRVNRAGITARIAVRLPPGWKAATSPIVERLYSLITDGDASTEGGESCLWVNGTKLGGAPSLNGVLDLLERDLQLYVAEMARKRIFVHAGVVGWRDRAILVPGRSFDGKTTLVSELVRAGATYYSDEYAVLDALGRVHPYARPLSFRGAQGERRRLTAEALGGCSGTRSLPVGLVVVTHYKADGSWQPQKLTAGAGLLALLRNTLPARRRPAAALAGLAQVVRHALVVGSERNEAACVAPAILSLQDRSFET